MSIKGQLAGGINAGFARLSQLDLVRWDDEKLADYDAIVLPDTQPMSAYSPLPREIPPTAVIDHHRGGDHKPLPICGSAAGCGSHQFDRLQLFHGTGRNDFAGLERACYMRSKRIWRERRDARASWTTLRG